MSKPALSSGQPQDGLLTLAISSVRSSDCSPGAYCSTAAATTSSNALAESLQMDALLARDKQKEKAVTLVML